MGRNQGWDQLCPVGFEDFLSSYQCHVMVIWTCMGHPYMHVRHVALCCLLVHNGFRLADDTGLFGSMLLFCAICGRVKVDQANNALFCPCTLTTWQE
jgi:hypothetical protein